MSAKSSSPAAFNDCKAVMDMALKKPGLLYKAETSGKTINFISRCNRLRKLLRDMDQEMYEGIPGHRSTTIYDILVIRQVDNEGKFNRKGLFARFDHESIEGQIIDPDTGEIIDLEIEPTHIIFDE